MPRRHEFFYRVIVEKGRHNGDYSAYLGGPGLAQITGQGQSPSEAAASAMSKAAQRLYPEGRKKYKANRQHWRSHASI